MSIKYSGENVLTYLLGLLNTKFGTKVDKVEGKGLSKNDLTDTLKTNYDAAYTHTSDTVSHVTAAEKSSWNAKQSPATTLSGYGITNAYTKTEIDSKLSSAMNYKGSKTNYSDLPTTGNVKGDVWNVTNADTTHNIKAGDNVAWNGSSWDVLSGIVDLSGYTPTSEIVEFTNSEIDTIWTGVFGS